MTFAKVRAVIFVAVLFITAGVVVIMAIGRDSQNHASAGAGSCPSGLVPAHIKMPEQNQDVTIKVFNGTQRVGLADQIAGEFANRGFTVDEKTESLPDGQNFDGIAEIVYGPDAVGGAWLVSAYFLVDLATMTFDIEREGATVDVIIGTDFQQLATTTEVNQSIAALGNPKLEPGTCDADA